MNRTVVLSLLIVTAIWLPMVPISGMAQSSADRRFYELQLTLSDSNVSFRPVIEFRARSAYYNSISDNSPGHAFVLIGRQLDNGFTYFSSVGGFYPEPNETGETSIKSTVYGDGEVSYRLPDLSYDQTFTVFVTPEQQAKAEWILENWEEKSYAIAWQNCVTLMQDIARAIGLDTSYNWKDFWEGPADDTLSWPVIRNNPRDFIRQLQINGDVGSALKSAEISYEERLKIREQVVLERASWEKRREAYAKKIMAINQLRRSVIGQSRSQSIGFGFEIGPTGNQTFTAPSTMTTTVTVPTIPTKE